MRLLVIPLLLTLPGCALLQPVQPPPVVIEKTRTVDTGCDWTKAILVSRYDVFTDETAKQVRDHNQAGAERCGWKPLKK